MISSRTSQLPWGKLTDYTASSCRMRCFIFTGLHTSSWHRWSPLVRYVFQGHCLWTFSSKQSWVEYPPVQSELKAAPGSSDCLATLAVPAQGRKLPSAEKVLRMRGAAAWVRRPRCAQKRRSPKRHDQALTVSPRHKDRFSNTLFVW